MDKKKDQIRKMPTWVDIITGNDDVVRRETNMAEKEEPVRGVDCGTAGGAARKEFQFQFHVGLGAAWVADTAYIILRQSPPQQF